MGILGSRVTRFLAALLVWALLVSTPAFARVEKLGKGEGAVDIVAWPGYIGTPAQIYERPATGFVAGFVGVSNVCDGELARRLAGSAEPFTIRPERIRLGDPEGPAGEDAVSASGVIDGALYLGAATRYTVSVDGGGQLLVLVQNLDDAKPAGTPGQRVRLTWQRRHQQPLRSEPAP
jgi:ABC-type Fe3+/spermidine/putrescine transport system ATPase subunit